MITLRLYVLLMLTTILPACTKSFQIIEGENFQPNNIKERPSCSLINRFSHYYEYTPLGVESVSYISNYHFGMPKEPQQLPYIKKRRNGQIVTYPSQYEATPIISDQQGMAYWIRQNILTHSKIKNIVRQTVIVHANGQWQAPHGGWYLNGQSGFTNSHPYNVNFDVRAIKTGLSTNWLQRRDVDIHLRLIGPDTGAYGKEQIVRMVALKHRHAPNSDWVICPV